VRLGLIGAGRWGRNYIKTIRALPAMSLCAVASRNPASKDLVDSNCRVTPNWRELIDPQLVDGVIIATPPDLHAEMLEAAIRARLPAMVEKPLTLNLPDALKLQSLQGEFSTPVLVDHIRLRPWRGRFATHYYRLPRINLCRCANGRNRAHPL